MKGLFAILTGALFILFTSCKESGVQLSKPSTFVKYFSDKDGRPNEAVDVLQTSKGDFIILSYSKPSNSNIGRINLTKTSVNGNTLKETTIENPLMDIHPSNFVAIKSGPDDTGYLIVGTIQNPNFGSRLFVAKVGSDLEFAAGDSVSYHTKSGDALAYRAGTGVYLKGKGVAQTINSTNDFFVTAEVVTADLTTHSTNDMYLAQINGSTLDTVFTHTFGAGTSELANRLYLNDAQTKVYWGGTRNDNTGTHMLLIRSGFNAEPQGTDWGQTYPVGSLSDNYEGNDFCVYGANFGFIGSHVDSQNPGQYDAIVFAYPNGNDGLSSVFKSYSLANSQTAPPGSSICSTRDGGFLLLGTEAVDAQGTNTDYSLIKIDVNGNQPKDWPTAKNYGGKYPDVGKRVLQSSDGGYVVLGTTTLANVKTVFFMKTDASGNIQ